MRIIKNTIFFVVFFIINVLKKEVQKTFRTLQYMFEILSDYHKSVSKNDERKFQPFVLSLVYYFTSCWSNLILLPVPHTM